MKFFNYLFYLLKHKWFVMIECFKYGLVWRGLIHDMSKFKLSEFTSYMNYFYGTYDDKVALSGGVGVYTAWRNKVRTSREDKFNLAWLKHQKVNKHHWQWWILEKDDGGSCVLPMETKYVKEMICDWVGAGRARGKKSPKNDKYDETRRWYLSRKNKMRFHKKTRTMVEYLLGLH